MHLLVQTGGDCSYDDFYVLLEKTYTLLALGICCCSIFVLITGVKGNQGCWFFFYWRNPNKTQEMNTSCGLHSRRSKRGEEAI